MVVLDRRRRRVDGGLSRGRRATGSIGCMAGSTSTRAALDAQLLRRAAVTLEIAASGLLDPATSVLLASAAHEARAGSGDDADREVVESRLDRRAAGRVRRPRRGRNAGSRADRPRPARRTRGGHQQGAVGSPVLQRRGDRDVGDSPAPAGALATAGGSRRARRRFSRWTTARRRMSRSLSLSRTQLRGRPKRSGARRGGDVD